MRKSPYNACAFVGGKPEAFAFGTDENDLRCVALKEAVKRAVVLLQGKGVNIFITGCGRGVDIWAGEIVYGLMKNKQLKKNPALYAFVPYKNQSTRWSKADATRWMELQQKCTQVFFVQGKYSPGCNHLRNRKMVEHSRWLLVVYDKNTTLRNDTNYAVEYAKKTGRNILYIHPQTFQLSCERYCES